MYVGDALIRNEADIHKLATCVTMDDARDESGTGRVAWVQKKELGLEIYAPTARTMMHCVHGCRKLLSQSFVIRRNHARNQGVL